MTTNDHYADPITSTDRHESDPIASTDRHESDPIASTDRHDADPIASTDRHESDPIASTDRHESDPIASTDRHDPDSDPHPVALDHPFETPSVAAAPEEQASAERLEPAPGHDDSGDREPVSATTETAPVTEHAVPPPAPESADDRSLFGDLDLSGLRSRWDDVQAAFVDDPRQCVQKADGLVSDVVVQLTNGFTTARARLEEQWARGEEASTEDLRLALKRYREFFQRLLSV